MVTKRFLAGGIDQNSGAYHDASAAAGSTPAFDRAGIRRASHGGLFRNIPNGETIFLYNADWP